MEKKGYKLLEKVMKQFQAGNDSILYRMERRWDSETSCCEANKITSQLK